MGLDGGFAGLLEFFPNFARRAFYYATSRCNTTHRRQPVVVADSIIPTPTKTNLRAVNGDVEWDHRPKTA